MTAEKKEALARFMNTLGNYSLLDVAEYLKRVAPNLSTKADRAYHDGMNAFLGAVVGQEKQERPATPIPYADIDSFDRDAWLFLGPYGVTLEDVADYVGERNAATIQREQTSSMAMSDALRALPGDKPSGVGELLERHEQLTKPAGSFSDYLRNAPAGYGESK